MLTVAFVISLIIADLFKFGLEYKSGIFITFLDAVSHAMIYRSRSEPLLGKQSWIAIILTNIVLKRTGGLFACAVRGTVPSLERNAWQILTLFNALVVVYAIPKDLIYKNLRSPVARVFICAGLAFYRHRKMLYTLNIVNKLDPEQLYLPSMHPYMIGMLLVNLLCDGSSMTRAVHFLLVRSWKTKRINFPRMRRDVSRYVLYRTLPTTILYLASAKLGILETTGPLCILVRALSLCHAGYVQNVYATSIEVAAIKLKLAKKIVNMRCSQATQSLRRFRGHESAEDTSPSSRESRRLSDCFKVKRISLSKLTQRFFEKTNLNEVLCTKPCCVARSSNSSGETDNSSLDNLRCSRESTNSDLHISQLQETCNTPRSPASLGKRRGSEEGDNDEGATDASTSSEGNFEEETDSTLSGQENEMKLTASMGDADADAIINNTELPDREYSNTTRRRRPLQQESA